ncbi:putative E3 ubiquitin-protein ligase [Forsythia ovata]|uniref:E3 ubiquitin-protein ligase n=1 Tax=Forsythia ovata TaxID=205694 RepID=A0ABD1WBI5_9LAMI
MSHEDDLKQVAEEDDPKQVAEGDDPKQVAEVDVQMCKDDIKKLEDMISELRFESEASKIAALKRGIDPGYASTFQDNFGVGSVKPVWDCVVYERGNLSGFPPHVRIRFFAPNATPYMKSKG